MVYGKYFLVIAHQTVVYGEETKKKKILTCIFLIIVENRTHGGTKTYKNVFDNPNLLQNLWKKNGLLKQVRFCYVFSKT